MLKSIADEKNLGVFSSFFEVGSYNHNTFTVQKSFFFIPNSSHIKICFTFLQPVFYKYFVVSCKHENLSDNWEKSLLHVCTTFTELW